MNQQKSPLIFYEFGNFIQSIGLNITEYLAIIQASDQLTFEQLIEIFKNIREIDDNEIRTIKEYLSLNQINETLPTKKFYQILQKANEEKRQQSLTQFKEQKQNEQQFQKQKEKKKYQNIHKLLQQGIQILQIQDPSQLFDLVDSDQNGYINKIEFQNLIAQISFDEDIEMDINEIFQDFNNQNNGLGLTRENFISLIQDEYSMPIQLQSYSSQYGKKNINNLQNSQDDLEMSEFSGQHYHKLQDALLINENLQQNKNQIEEEFESSIFQMKPPDLRKQNSSDLRKNMVNSNIFANIIEEEEDLKSYSYFLILYTQLQKQNELFLDNQFAPNQVNLGEKYKQVEWQRASKMFGNQQVSIFSKNQDQNRQNLGLYIAPGDIIQGELGDCYFLSCLSSIAIDWPHYILKLFITQRYNPKGLYCVKLCVNGEWSAIILDDYFPVKQLHRNQWQPAFTKTSGTELWVLLLEKAWAKLSGSYQQIEAGYCREVMRVLTGAPTINLRTDDQDFLKEFKQLINQKYVITATATHDEQLNKNVQLQLGLVGNHAYSVMDLIDIVHKQRGQVLLVKLRNPWAKEEWKGDWSSTSSLWSEEQKKIYLKNQVGNGVFYMDIDSFIQYFPNIQVCLLRHGQIYSSLQCTSYRKSAQFIAFNIQTPGEYIFTINQPNQRLLYGYKNYDRKQAEELQKNYKYSVAKIILAKLINTSQGQKLQFIGAKFQTDMEVFLGSQLTKGDYIAYCKVYWKFIPCFNFVASMYGPNKVELRRVEKIDHFLENAYIDKARQAELKIIQLRGNKVQKRIDAITKEGIGYIYYSNISSKAYTSQLDLSNSKGIILKKQDRNLYPNMLLDMFLLPGEERIIIFNLDAEGYSYQINEKFNFIDL